MKLDLEADDIELIANKVAVHVKHVLAKIQGCEEKDRLMTVRELAEYLHVSTQCIYKIVQAKEIPYLKKENKLLMFRKKLIDVWLDSIAVPVVKTPTCMLKKVRQSI